jgi:hypothetical protein
VPLPLWKVSKHEVVEKKRVQICHERRGPESGDGQEAENTLPSLVQLQGRLASQVYLPNPLSVDNDSARSHAVPKFDAAVACWMLEVFLGWLGNSRAEHARINVSDIQ